MYDINVRSIPGRRLLAITRHVHAGETGGFFKDAFARLRAGGPGLEGIEGVPFLVFYGEVSDDSDGPMELCRPVAADGPFDLTGDVHARVEPAHDEALIRLTGKEMGWPTMLSACEALERWATDERRRPAGPLRQVLIADQRTATPDAPVCDLSLPLR
jgi:hypothetical protein